MGIISYMEKPIEDCTREELIEALRGAMQVIARYYKFITGQDLPLKHIEEEL